MVSSALCPEKVQGPRRLRKWALACLLPVATIACGVEPMEEEPVGEDESELITKCPKGPIVDGIDVSQWQGDVNFVSVRNANYRFAIARGASGTKPDEKFATNWSKMKSAGLIRGVYQYFRPAQDGAAQANVLLDLVERAGGLEAGDFPPVIDVEELGGRTPAQMMAEVKKWVSVVQRRTGRKPIVYANQHWEEEYGNPNNLGLPLWVAKYTTQWCPQIPSAWNEWVMWQYSEKGSVPGVQGPVDLNRFNGTLADLQAFIRGSWAGSGGGGGSACGSVTAAGTCSGSVVKRCVDGAVSTYDCSRNGLTCGWAGGRADCVASAGGGGACGSVTAAGVCSGTVVKRCVDGAVATYDCARNGLRCGWSASSGRNDCL
jgi:lysozyme